MERRRGYVLADEEVKLLVSEAEPIAFYCDLLGMEKIPTPTFAFPVQSDSARSCAWTLT
jgi:hypothetical protein